MRSRLPITDRTPGPHPTDRDRGRDATSTFTGGEATGVRRRPIRISDGSEVVGHGTIEGGRIECDAELGWGVYDAIEAAIAADRDAAEAGGIIYRWEIGD